MSDEHNNSCGSDDHRFDPDPFGISLAVLGAVGSAASIFTVVEDRVRRKRFHSRTQERREIFRSTTEVRGAVAELRSNFRYLIKRYVREAETEDRYDSRSPRFGAIKVILSPATADEYRETVAAIFDSLYRYHSYMIQLSQRLFLYLEDFDIPPVEQLMTLRHKAEDVLSREHSATDSMHMTDELLSMTEEALNDTFEWILHHD